MKTIFTDYLFNKHLLVHTGVKNDSVFEILVSLGNLFGIRIVSGQLLAEPEMIRTAERCLGSYVPQPFYRGFPQSVRKMSADALLFDQVLHYFTSYGLGMWDEPGHSLLEGDFERLAFRENVEVKDFTIITRQEAESCLRDCVDDLLSGTRPLSESQYALVQAYITEYGCAVTHCASKDTAVRLLMDTMEFGLAAFLRLSDVIRILDQMNYEIYGSENLKKLNLSNQERKFLTGIINTIFREGECDLENCFEKKKIWNGLLHHIHYKPINETAEAFVAAMRSKENLSVYSAFERHLQAGEIRDAVQALRKGKGSGALLRKLNYIISRCKRDEDVEFVLKNLHTDNAVILIQMILAYRAGQTRKARTFKFTKHNLMKVHKESEKEYRRCKTWISDKVRTRIVEALWENLAEIYHGRLGKVYIAPGMERIAVALQETTASGGYGVLPKGSRIPIRAGKKVRCFTYWEQVNDIDLSVIAITKDNRQLEFSWRSMCDCHSECITYSGDQTRGFYGGSEYFDIDLEKFTRAYPQVKYLILCNNVFSGTPFSRCLCKAGYMDRDILDSGAVFEPKTVATAFKINCESTFAYLFGIDLKRRELVWLNVARDSNVRVAGTTSLAFLQEYFDATDTMNVAQLFSMLAAEVVDSPDKADVIVSDEQVQAREGVEIIHSYDTERIMALMNG